MLTCHDVARRETTSDAIIGGNCVEPEHGVLHQVDENNAGNVSIGQHAICAPGAIFDRSDVTFNVGNMLIGRSGVNIGIPRAKMFEFVIGKYGVNNKPPGLVKVEDLLQEVLNSPHLAVWESLNGGELKIPRLSHKERDLVHKHDVNGESQVLVKLDYFSWNGIDSSCHVGWGAGQFCP